MITHLYTFKHGIIYRSVNPVMNWCYLYVDVHGAQYRGTGFTSKDSALHCFTDFLMYTGHIHAERAHELQEQGGVEAVAKQIEEGDIQNIWAFVRAPIDPSGRRKTQSYSF